MSRPGGAAALIPLVLVAADCTVDDGYLDERLFPCNGPSDCGDGWACVRASPYASDFCAPECDEERECDGICIRQKRNEVERELCLRGCRIREDGSTSSCPEGFSCIRVSVESNDGVCYPVTSCNDSAGCSSNEICLSELTGAARGDRRTDHFYCAPVPDEANMCPARSTVVELEPSTSMCLGTCDPPDTRCPPGFGCLQQLSLFAREQDVPCFPGLYGVPCDDDTNCLFGRCTDVGDAGRMCTISCDEAARLVGGCANLFGVDFLSPVFQLECDPSAGDASSGGLCVTRYDIGFVCTTPESDAYSCAEGLECRELATSEGQVKLCTKECQDDDDCNDVREAYNYCLQSQSLCLPKMGDGSTCARGAQCASTVCEGGRCQGDGA